MLAAVEKLAVAAPEVSESSLNSSGAAETDLDECPELAKSQLAALPLAAVEVGPLLQGAEPLLQGPELLLQGPEPLPSWGLSPYHPVG